MNTECPDVSATLHAEHVIRDLLTAKRTISLAHQVDCDCECDLDVVNEYFVAEMVAAGFTARFERQINKHGVPVRQIVLTGPQECDPMAPNLSVA